MLQGPRIDLIYEVIDEINELKIASTNSSLSKKYSDHVNRHLKKSIDKLEKIAPALEREDDKKYRKEYKKLRSEMDKVVALLTYGSHQKKSKKQKKPKKNKKYDPVVTAPLLAKAEAIQVSILQLAGDGGDSDELDRDGDGIINDLDLFPDDPFEWADNDSDGIGDNGDLCLFTPLREVIDSVGCSSSQLDDDNDDVSNAVDQCPTTQYGEAVNALGCAASELDSDDDTVSDDLDQCPSTLTGIIVDEAGCPIVIADDDDRDTIANLADNCPTIFNPDQLDTDTDGTGDACEIIGNISITSPVPGQVIETSTISVAGVFSGPDGSSVNVNARDTCVYNNQFIVNNLPVNQGDHSITAQIVPSVGIGDSTQVAIKRDGDSLYSIKPNTSCAVAPFDASFKLENVNTNIVEVAIDYDNDGLIDVSITDFSNPELTHIYADPGAYQVSINGFDTTGNSHYQSLNLIVQDGEAINSVIQAGWANITAGLGSGNSIQALAELTPNAQEKYGPVFEALQGNLPAILSTFSGLQVVDINTDYAEYAINRTVDGINRIFLIYFVKDQNGNWKLDAM